MADATTPNTPLAQEPPQSKPTVLVKKADGSFARVVIGDILGEEKKEIEKLGNKPARNASQSDRDPGGEIVPTAVGKKLGNSEIGEQPAPNVQEEQQSQVPQKTLEMLVAETIRQAQQHHPDTQNPQRLKQGIPVQPVDFFPARETPHALSTTAPVKQIFVDEAIARKLGNSPDSGREETRKLSRQPSGSRLTTRKTENKEISPPRGVDSVAKEQPQRTSGNEKKEEAVLKDKNAVQLQRFDSGSLLEGAAHRQPQRYASLSDKTQEQVLRMMRELSFPVSDDVDSRLRSLLLSRVKGVRTNDQVAQYAAREKDRGGLGLSSSQGAEFSRVIEKFFPEKQSREKQRFSSEATQKEKSLLSTLVPESEMPDISYDLPLPKGPERAQKIAPSPRQNSDTPRGNSRPVLQDVAVPEREKRTVGPVEEIRLISLTDFRRLAPTVATAERILLDKFAVLKQESFLLYMQGRNAWYESPLYNEYQGVVKQALDNGQPLRAVAQSVRTSEGMAFEEIAAVVGINRSLEL